jgi:hypothetical protein
MIGFLLILIAFCSIKTFIVPAITSFNFMTISRWTTASTDETVVRKIGGRFTTQWCFNTSSRKQTRLLFYKFFWSKIF